MKKKDLQGTPEEEILGYPKQSQEELVSMAEFYAQQYGMVYFIRCMNCERVIAVEVPKPGGGNTQRGVEIFGYQGLFMTTRNRLDKTPTGKPMVGYECACGNDTRLSALEKGIVPTSTVLYDKAGNITHADPAPPSLSPFERDKMRREVASKEASDSYTPDYEADGNTERYETFIVERVK